MNEIVTEVVSTFGDFERQIKEFNFYVEEQSRKYGEIYIPVFRGVHEKKEQGIVLEKYLKPSIVVNELVSREREIIDEIKRLRPLEFNNLSELDLLGKCQHFSLPTRLLDFSRSPYVALFFAVTYFQKCPFNLREIDKCPNFLDRDYKVYCVAAKLKKSIYTSKIASVATKFNNGEDNFVEDFLFGENFSKENFVRAVEDIICEAHFFYPKFYTQREQNQQSIFLILSNYIQDKQGIIDFTKPNWAKGLYSIKKREDLKKRFVFQNDLINPFLNDMSNKLFIKEIIISGGLIAELKEKLDFLGIDESFLFPENIEYTSGRIIKNFRG